MKNELDRKKLDERKEAISANLFCTFFEVKLCTNPNVNYVSAAISKKSFSQIRAKRATSDPNVNLRERTNEVSRAN